MTIHSDLILYKAVITPLIGGCLATQAYEIVERKSNNCSKFRYLSLAADASLLYLCLTTVSNTHVAAMHAIHFLVGLFLEWKLLQSESTSQPNVFFCSGARLGCFILCSVPLRVLEFTSAFAAISITIIVIVGRILQLTNWQDRNTVANLSNSYEGRSQILLRDFKQRCRNGVRKANHHNPVLTPLTLPPRDGNYTNVLERYRDDQVFSKYCCSLSKHPIRYPVKCEKEGMFHYYEFKEFCEFFSKQDKENIPITISCIDINALREIEDRMRVLEIPLQ